MAGWLDGCDVTARVLALVYVCVRTHGSIDARRIIYVLAGACRESARGEGQRGTALEDMTT